MRHLLAFLLTVCVSLPAMGAELPSWDFAGASSALGWKTMGPVRDFLATPAGIAGTSAGYDPQIISPAIDVPAAASQYLLITIKSSAPSEWQLFWANSTSGQYGGFEPEKQVNFTVSSPDFETVRVFPFWGEGQKVVRLRLDPPDDSDISWAIKSVRLVDAAASEKELRSWESLGDPSGWKSTIGLKKDGQALVATSQDNLILSPSLRIPAEGMMWASVRMKAEGTDRAWLVWANDLDSGLQKLAFPIIGDGRMRTYNIDLSGESAWRGNIRAVGLQPSESSGAKVTVEQVTAGRERQGEASLVVSFLGTKQPYPRAGQVEIEARVVNNGGKASEPVKLGLKHALGIVNVVKPFAPISEIAPGATAAALATVEFDRDGSYGLVVTDESGKGAIADFPGRVNIGPAIPRAGSLATYVPQPKPVDTRGYEIGCYYFPGWHTYQRWSVLDAFPEREPLLGYYREGDREVADWHIKWAVEHGISFFVYDWYWSKGGRSLEHALHDGFFKARYQNLMKFCLLWANHNPKGSSSLEDMKAVTRFWIDNYFKRSNYLKIDGKPVVVIFSPDRFREDLGTPGTRAAFDAARQICREAGLPGLYLVACTYPGKARIQMLEQEGYDALSGYNYPTAGNSGRQMAPYDDMVEAFKDYWKQIDDAANIPYIPIAEAGWDARPWHGAKSNVRTGKHPDKFGQMLRNAKGFLDAPGRALPDGRKMLLIEAWNEFGEGDYVEPHREFGFGYLDAIRKVFTIGDLHTDIVPADIGLGPYALDKPQPVTAWTFDRRVDGISYQNMSANIEGGALVGTSDGNDPGIYLPGALIEASKCKKMVVRMSVSAGQTGQLFWSDKNSGLAENKSIIFKIAADGQMHDYELTVGSHARWAGTITNLRLDPTDAKGAKIRVESIRCR